MTDVDHCVQHCWCGAVLLQWHRTATTQETDGFQVKRPGDQNVKCTLLLMLDYQVCIYSEEIVIEQLVCVKFFWKKSIIVAVMSICRLFADKCSL